MSDLTISRDSSLPVDPASGAAVSSTQTQVNQAQTKVSDSLSSAAVVGENTAQSSSTIDFSFPQLARPRSSGNFYKALLEAIAGFEQYLFVSNVTDQQTRIRGAGIASLQAKKVSDLLDKRLNGMRDAKAEAKAAAEELKKQLDAMEKLFKQQRDLIEDVNDGNGDEKEAYQELVEAREKYLEKLKEIGVVDKGNGTFSVPEDAEDDFNDLTEDYQEAVDDFNDYWKDRSQDLKNYNAATETYNQKVKEYNQIVQNLINKYNLQNFLAENDFSVPFLKEADLRDLSNYANSIGAPSTISKAPADVNIPGLPGYAGTLADKGPPSLTELGSESFDMDQGDIYSEIYDQLYTRNIGALDQELTTQMSYWNYLIVMESSRSLNAATPEPLMNDKVLLRQFIEFMTPQVYDPSHMIEEKSILDALGLNKPQLQDMLMKTTLQRTLQDQLKLSEQEAQPLADQLVVLAIGLISQTSLQALFPSLVPLKENELLATLPTNSPVFALLFATSFANRIQEETEQGLVAQALETFIESTPELSSLSPAGKKELEGALNVSLLLMATKMMEINLGLPGLSIQLLAPLLPVEAKTLIVELQQEKKQETLQLTQQFEQQFLAEGYAPEEARFLAQLGVELEPVLSAPQATTVSASSIQSPLLINSLKAALVLDRYPLKEATEISQQAVQSTLNAGPYPSTNLFRSALNNQLQELGLPEQKTQELASQAILLPPFPPSLSVSLLQTSSPTENEKQALPGTNDANTHVVDTDVVNPEKPRSEALLTTSAQESTAPSPSPIQEPLLLPIETLRAIVETRILTLLTPQLGAVVASKVNEEVLNTLNLNPTAAAKAEATFIYSLPNVTRRQVTHLQTYHSTLESHRVRTDELTTAFKATFKHTYDGNALFQRMMDPAYRFLYSASTGIMGKNDDNWKNPMSIMV